MPTDPDELDMLDAWAEMVEVSSYYELLGVLEIADEASIKAAFHEFASAFHPDVHRAAEPGFAAKATLIFQRGAEAYRVLMDPALRSRYDLALTTGQLRLTVNSSPAPSLRQSQARSLENLCRSSAARMCARKADELISQGQLHEAKKELKMALYHEENANSELSQRLEDLETMLFAQGD